MMRCLKLIQRFHDRLGLHGDLQGLWNELDTEQLGVVRLIDLDEAWQNDVHSALLRGNPFSYFFLFFYCQRSLLFLSFECARLSSPIYTGLEYRHRLSSQRFTVFKAAGAGCTLD